MESRSFTWRVGRPPIKARVASVVYWTLDHLCAWTGHLRGCWLLNRSPVKRLWHWAADHDVHCWVRGEGAWHPGTSGVTGWAELVELDGLATDPQAGDET